MSKNTARRVPEEDAATPAEIIAAIESLTEADFQRLRAFARRRIRLLGAKAGEKGEEDLLHDAVTDLMSDTRRWNKTKVGFMAFLCGAMKSMSSNWAKAYRPDDVPVLATNLERMDKDGNELSPYEKARDASFNPEQKIEFSQILAETNSLLADDKAALGVLEGWYEGFSPAEIRELESLSQNDYDTIVRRIRRRIKAAGLGVNLFKGGPYVN